MKSCDSHLRGTRNSKCALPYRGRCAFVISIIALGPCKFGLLWIRRAACVDFWYFRHPTSCLQKRLLYQYSVRLLAGLQWSAIGLPSMLLVCLDSPSCPICLAGFQASQVRHIAIRRRSRLRRASHVPPRVTANVTLPNSVHAEHTSSLPASLLAVVLITRAYAVWGAIRNILYLLAPVYAGRYTGRRLQPR